MEEEGRIKRVLEHTRVVRPPRQKLATFGSSVVEYWVVTELGGNMTVVRDGKVTAERPRIVTPSYLVKAEGFSEQARGYIKMMAREHPREAGIFYRYRNEPGGMDVVSESLTQVINRLDVWLDEVGNQLSAIIKGVEELWDVSLLMFIYELTQSSLYTHINEFRRLGSFDIDSAGVPQDARNYIEDLFEQVRTDLSRAPYLVNELNRWDLFSEYEDRFLALFRGK